MSYAELCNGLLWGEDEGETLLPETNGMSSQGQAPEFRGPLVRLGKGLALSGHLSSGGKIILSVLCREEGVGNERD